MVSFVQIDAMEAMLYLTHCGRATQICVFTLQLCRMGDADLRFSHGEPRYICKFSLVPLHKGECFQRYRTLKHYWVFDEYFLKISVHKNS